MGNKGTWHDSGSKSEGSDSAQGDRRDFTGESSEKSHLPVLLAEAVDRLSVKPASIVIDCTFGGGGHTAEILARISPSGRVLALDADPAAIERGERRFTQEIASGRLVLVNANFASLEVVASARGFGDADAILLDLGVSSFQIDEPGRGFSFQSDGPLDMRMDPHQKLTAYVIVNEWPESELADTIYMYGDERKSRRIARRIVAQRPIRSTAQLAGVVTDAVGGRRGQRIHPATRTFQALRIAVNGELDSLRSVLPQCLEVLRPGGRLAVISFHSLEDRIVKQWMQQEAADFLRDPAHPFGGVERTPTVRLLERKPVMPSAEEVSRNPRSRSARLRVAEKCAI